MAGKQKNKKPGNQPEKKFNSGLVRATVWKNKSSTGDEFRTVSLSRGYQKDGEWKNTNSMGEGHLEQAISVLKQARDFINGSGAEEGEEAEDGNVYY